MELGAGRLGVRVAVAVGVVAVAAGSAYALGRATDDRSPAADAASATPSTTIADAATTASEPPTTTPTTAPPTTASEPPTTTPTTTPPSVADPPDVNVFPIQPASAASYARSHHDYPAADIFAECGLDVVAPATGTVQEVTVTDVWSSSVNAPETRGGLSFSIVGDDGVRYYGSHLDSIDDGVRPGARLAAGERIGTVGDSGNAAGTGCHLHFGISTPCGPGDVLRRRGEFWPQEYLDAWRAGAPRSPVDRVRDSSC